MDETIAALRNSGIDTDCGACMEVAFTGVTTNTHTCDREPRPSYDFDKEARIVCEAIGSTNGWMTIMSALHEAYQAGRAVQQRAGAKAGTEQGPLSPSASAAP